MFIVTNTLKTEKTATSKVIDKFTSHGDIAIEGIAGFLSFEVWQARSEKDYDEIVVVSKWETRAQQKAWLKTEKFKKAHGRTKDDQPSKPKNIGVISNEINEYDQMLFQQPVIS